MNMWEFVLGWKYGHRYCIHLHLSTERNSQKCVYRKGYLRIFLGRIRYRNVFMGIEYLRIEVAMSKSGRDGKRLYLRMCSGRTNLTEKVLKWVCPRLKSCMRRSL